MSNIVWDKLELTETTFDDMNSCNACGAENSNDVTVEDTVSFHICGASTKCKLCGHEDYWGYGHFMSNEHIEGKAKQV